MRVSSAHEHLRRQGRYTGGRVPYGYMVVPNPNGAGKVLAVDEDEAETIKRIVERVLTKDSLMQIINDLNKEGVPSPGHTSRQTTGKRSDSKQWYTTTLRGIMHWRQEAGHVASGGVLRRGGAYAASGSGEGERTGGRGSQRPGLIAAAPAWGHTAAPISSEGDSLASSARGEGEFFSASPKGAP
ncbi:recombinase family protein [Streptomyces sp. ATCC 21386]|uniref:recombinase family protein n=1 Tax=Streptomyces sp. ATCC 21386 TaxID=2699428 RepID=UPI002044D2F9|nr:recombinase family protein [Streptomyces sp. ATCC 21386]